MVSNPDPRATVFLRASDSVAISKIGSGLGGVELFRQVQSAAGTRFELHLPRRSSAARMAAEGEVMQRVFQLREDAKSSGVAIEIELALWLGEDFPEFCMTGNFRQWINAVDEVWCETEPSTGSMNEDLLIFDIEGRPEWSRSFYGADSMSRQKWLDSSILELVRNGDEVSIRLASGGGIVGIVLDQDVLRFLASSNVSLNFTSLVPE